MLNDSSCNIQGKWCLTDKMLGDEIPIWGGVDLFVSPPPPPNSIKHQWAMCYDPLNPAFCVITPIHHRAASDNKSNYIVSHRMNFSVSGSDRRKTGALGVPRRRSAARSGSIWKWICKRTTWSRGRRRRGVSVTVKAKSTQKPFWWSTGALPSTNGSFTRTPGVKR